MIRIIWWSVESLSASYRMAFCIRKNRYNFDFWFFKPDQIQINRKKFGFSRLIWIKHQTIEETSHHYNGIRHQNYKNSPLLMKVGKYFILFSLSHFLDTLVTVRFFLELARTHTYTHIQRTRCQIFEMSMSRTFSSTRYILSIFLPPSILFSCIFLFLYQFVFSVFCLLFRFLTVHSAIGWPSSSVITKKNFQASWSSIVLDGTAMS